MAEETPYADPSDLQFGKAAKEKQEVADALEAEGQPVDVNDDDDPSRPRAGNKAPVENPPQA